MTSPATSPAKLLRHMLLGLLVLTLSTASLAYAGDEAPRARAYMDWTLNNISQTKADLAPITAAANAAAPLIVDGKELGIQERSIATELGGRAGGFYMIKGRRAKAGDIVLYPINSCPALKPKSSEAQDEKEFVQQSIDEMKSLKSGGSLVIAIASFEQLKKLELFDEAKKATDHLIDNHAPANDGLFTDAKGKHIIPTFPVANAVTAWAFSAELYAAITRHGKTPAMYQSVAIEGARERNNALKGKRFEDVNVAPVPEGILAETYLDGVAKLLNEVGTVSWKNLVRASDRVYGTMADGGKAYVNLFAHYPPYHFDGSLAADPGLLIPINKRGVKLEVPPGDADCIVALGYCMPPYDKVYGQREVYEKAGKGTIWIVTTYDTMDSDRKPNDIIVDQQWPAGDAVVDVKGYDVRIFPPSGIITEVIGWSIVAQAQHEYEAHMQSKEGAAKRTQNKNAEPAGAGVE